MTSAAERPSWLQGGGNAEQREGAPLEGSGSCRLVEAQDGAAAGVDQPAGDVEHLVAQALGPGRQEARAEADRLGPAEQVLGQLEQEEPVDLADVCECSQTSILRSKGAVLRQFIIRWSPPPSGWIGVSVGVVWPA